MPINEMRRAIAEHRYFLLAGFVVFGAASLVAGQATKSSAQDRQKMMAQVRDAQKARSESLKRGIVRVDAQKENAEAGTGVLIYSAPNVVRILTALHVVQDAKAITVSFYSDQTRPYPARMLPKINAALDLAVLEVRTSGAAQLPSDLPTYDFASNDTLESGQHITTVNGEWVEAQNNITRLSHDGDAQKFEYSNVAVGEGFSGGPIFNDYGNIVAMHDAMNGPGTYAVAVKIGSALDALGALGYQVPKAGEVVLPNYRQMTGSPAPSEAAAPSVPGVTPPSRPLRAGAAASGLCANGCTATLGSMRNVGHYTTTMGRFPCYEDVFALPKGWPGDNLFLHTNNCPTMSGAVAQSIRINFGATNRSGDQDSTLGLAVLNGSTGQGYLNLRNSGGGRWKISFQNPAFGGTVNVKAISMTIQP